MHQTSPILGMHCPFMTFYPLHKLFPFLEYSSSLLLQAKAGCWGGLALALQRRLGWILLAALFRLAHEAELLEDMSSPQNSMGHWSVSFHSDNWNVLIRWRDSLHLCRVVTSCACWSWHTDSVLKKTHFYVFVFCFFT